MTAPIDRTPTVLAVTAALALVVAACGDGGPAGDGVDPARVSAPQDRPTIITTTSIWADVVANLACDGSAMVEPLVPVGADPHVFEPSLADRRRLDDADLVVANGLRLEEGLDDTLDASVEAGTPVVRIAEHVGTIDYGAGERRGDGGGADADDEHGHDTGEDPHVWLDPVRVAGVLAPLANRLVADAGLDRSTVDGCLDAYRAELLALDSEIEQLVAPIPDPQRTLVTNHDSLGYFADRYGFEIIGTIIPAPSGLAEANPAQLEALADLIAATGTPAVFAETQHSLDVAEALAARVGDVQVVTLFTGTLGPDGSGADTYVGLLRTNAELITNALGSPS